MRVHPVVPRPGRFPRCLAAGSLDEACHALVDELVEAGFELPSIYLLVADRLRCHAARGYFQVVDGFPAGGPGVIGGVVASGCAEIIPDIRTRPGFIAAIPGLAAEACFPVRCGGQVIGVVNVESRSRLPADTVEVVGAAAACLGRRIQDLGGLPVPSLAQRLARIAIELTAASKVEDIEQRTLHAAAEIAGMSSAALARRTPDGAGWTTATHGPLSPQLGSFDSGEWDVLESWVSSDTSSHFPGGNSVPAEYQFVHSAGIRAVSVHPLVVGGRRDGVLVVASARPVAHAMRVVESLEVLAAQAAASLGLVNALDEASRRADHDLLTGLGNRSHFHSTVALALRRHDHRLAVLLLDLDDFKNVNDSLGHQAGDELLVETAHRLRGCLRPGATVCRLGGDEFVVVLPGATRRDAAQVARRLLGAVSSVGFVEGSRLETTSSIGIAVRTGQQETAEELLKAADFAMYLAKERGKGQFAFFEPQRRLRARERLALESDLRAAFDADQLDLAYQPIIDLATGRMTAVEALLRWDSPRRGAVLPAAFVPLAEEKGLIVPLGRWVLRRACAQLARWDVELSGAPLQLAVNVSTRQLERPGLVAELDGCLSRGLDPSRIVLEITETALSLNNSAAHETLQTLRARGVQIAVDDFGTGYSSLVLLQSAPVSRLKIDRAFVGEIKDADADVPIVDAIITMAHRLGLDVVAEGVETPAQLAYLRRVGCEHAQGYLLSRPVPPEQIGSLPADAGHPRAWPGRARALRPASSRSA